jgi:hypothetical protein
LAVNGCHKAAPVEYCNAGDSGPVLGQVASITLSPTLATVGESLNYGQIGQALSASAVDCKGNAVSVRSFVYSSTSSFSNSASGAVFADINPSDGQVCGGTWNRNSGGGIADYTLCAAPSSTPSTFLALVTATANGAVSNAIPVYVHPVVTGVVLGAATPNCATSTDPGTDCFPLSTSGPIIAANVYTGTGCVSQSQTGQLVARVYANGNTAPGSNITGEVGHLTFGTLTSGIVTIDQNGVATANQPGGTVVTATLSNSSTATNAGYFATCPPASIILSIPGQPAGTTSLSVSLNNLQPLNTTVLDTAGNTITGLNLEFNSTSPQNIPASNSSVTPAFPGSATITAVCQPATCNPSPFSQIGLYGNGKPITSNGITINTAGVSSTVLYMGSLTSQYVEPIDFTTGQASPQIKLPYVPNSMVINQAGTAIYLGSPQGLMTINTTGNTVGALNQNVTGTVLSVSPDGSTVVVTDPVRQTISLVTSAGAVSTSYGGVGVAAQWSPDSQTVYIITTGSTVLTHTAFTAWQSITTQQYKDLAVTVPSVGAYFAGTASLDGRSYCSSGTLNATATPPNTVTNSFTPLADTESVVDDKLGATTDGNHILGAHAAGAASTFNDLTITNLEKDIACPVPPAIVPTNYFTSTPSGPKPLTGVTANAITGVFPSSNSVVAFVTYTPTAAVVSGGALLPYYQPATGTLTYLPLANGASTSSAPVTGVFSTDNLTFYVGTGTFSSLNGTGGTSADNDVHLFTLTYPTTGAPTVTESGIVSPSLPAASGTGTAPVTLLAQRPKRATS